MADYEIKDGLKSIAYAIERLAKAIEAGNRRA